MWLVIVIIVIGIIGGVIGTKRDEEIAQKRDEEAAKRKQELKDMYKKTLKDLETVIDNCQDIEKLPVVTNVTIEHRSNINNPSYYLYNYKKHYVWLKDKTLYMFPTFDRIVFENSVGGRSEYGISPNDWVLKSVPVDNIMFYRQIGTVYTTTTGSGGDSTFSPITGFHGKINPIKIESQVHDERTTQLFFDDGTKDQILIFQDKDYYVLRKLMPEKDYQVITLSEAVRDKSDAEFQRLEKLNKLLKSGLISDEDYQKKKEEILDNI